VVSPKCVRVLIVDDDARVRAALRAFLAANLGIEVVGETRTPAATVELVRARTPSVVLVDVLLSGLDDGLGLLRTLTAELAIPVVAISMRGDLAEAALAAGASRFLDKVGLPEHLVDALRAVG
jgi:DNA-binding NarL/FixJ family response regulator